MSPTVFVGIFLLYIAIITLVSTRLSGRQKSGESFLLGNRKVPLLLTLGTTVATMVGTGSSMGAIGEGYENGWAGSLYGIGGALGILALAWIFGHVRRYKFVTFAEEMAYYYGANSILKGSVAVLILFAEIGWLGAHILGGGLYLSWIAGIDLLKAKFLVAVGFSVYTIIGGYMAVVWTDTIQAIVLFAGFILLAFLAVDQSGGLANLEAMGASDAWAFTKGGQRMHSISLVYVIFVGVMATPSFRQRIYSASDIGSIKKSFTASGVLYLIFCIIPAIIGMSAYAINPELTHSDQAFPFLATEVLPPTLAIVVLIAGLSATMSSASSDSIAGVSILYRDVYKMISGAMPSRQKVVKYSRWGIFAINGIALICSLFATDIIDYIKYMISVVMSGLFVCSILGRFWQRATWQGGLAALLGGVITSIIVINNPHWDTFWGNPAIPSTLGAGLCAVIVSALTKPSNISKEEILAILENERKQMESESLVTG